MAIRRYVPRSKREDDFRPHERQRCIVFDNPEYRCVVVNVGPEQSEIKFDNGNVRFVPNSWLKPDNSPRPVV